MKVNYKHKTGAFGDSAENYVSRVFMLAKHPKRTRRPDLIAPEKSYNPVLSLEVKSGAKKKGILVDYQLHYSITTVEDYRELFGEDPPESIIKGSLVKSKLQPRFLLRKTPVSYYYCVIDRVDGITAAEMDRPYASLQCKYGDMFLVPPEFAFFSFVACRVGRTGERIAPVIRELKELVRKDAISWRSEDYDRRKGHLYSWQNLQGKDVHAFFEDDLSLTTIHGKKRLQIIGNCMDLSSLKRIKIPGPNNSTIYVLAHDEDSDLFDKQVRKTVEERIPVIERVTRARQRNLNLVAKIARPRINLGIFFPDTGPKAQSLAKKRLRVGEVNKLERLATWLDNGEEELSPIPNPF